MTVGMVPWSDNGIYMSTILGVATFSYIPYMWMNYACILVAIIYGFAGWFMWDNKKDVRVSVRNQQLEQEQEAAEA